MKITVVLQGAPNDRDAFQAAMRMAAREGAAVHVVLAGECTRETFEKHLDFALRDVRERLELLPPPVDVECRRDRLSVEREQTRRGAIVARAGG